jgi:hypothetical protein
MGFFSQLLSSAITVGLGFLMPGAATFALPLFLQRTAVMFALGYVSSALSKPPKQELQDNKVTNRDPIASRKLIYGKTRVGGTIVYMGSTGDTNEYLHMVVTLATHQVLGVDEVYFNDELVWDGAYIGDWDDVAEITVHLGSETQAADSNLVSRVTDWTEDHTLSGVAYLYIRLKFDRDKFAMGIPNVTALVRGKNNGMGYYQNPAWCLRDYLLDTKYGMGILASEIDEDSFAEAASVCDEFVQVTETTYETRYLMSGVVDLSKTRSQIIEEMLTCMGGVFTYTGGKFHLHASKYYAPTLSFDESDITGQITIQTKKSRRDLYNGVKGVFNSEEDNYIAADYPPVISETYELEDGDPAYLDLNLPFTTSSSIAQRLAKLVLLQGRQHITATIPLNLKAITAKVGDFITVSNSRLGWDNKEFRVVNYELSVDASGEIGANLQVVETSEAIYDWSYSELTPFVAGVATTLPPYYSVNAPTDMVLSTGSVVITDGTLQSYIDVSWTNNDAFAVSYEVQYRKGTDDFKSVITNNTKYRIDGVEPSYTYDVQVRAINRVGARSTFLQSAALSATDTDAPAPPTSVTATGGYELISIKWTNPVAFDLKHVEIWESDTDASEAATLIATSAGSSFTRVNLAANVTKYYFLKAVDFSGNASDFSLGDSATTIYIDDTSFESGVRSLFTDQGLDIIEPVNSLPASGEFVGQQVFLTTEGKLYSWNGTTWELTIAGVADNYITGSKIVANTITGGLLATSGIITSAAQIEDAVITNAKIDSIDATKITTGQLASARIDTSELYLPSIGGIVTDVGPFATNTFAEYFVIEIGDGAGFYNGFLRVVGGTNHVKSMKFRLRNGTSTSDTLIYESQYTVQLEGHVDRFYSSSDTQNIPFAFSFDGTGTIGLFVYAQGDSGPDYLGSVEARFIKFGASGA